MEYYLKVMKRLREAVRRKRPDLWRGKNGCSEAFLLSNSRFSHKTRDEARPPAPVLVRLRTSGPVSHHQPEIPTERTTIGVWRWD